ncbi:N-acetyltransferase GCN5 [Planoprotostelium fungivorum]|uniref:N-acetyltransferase GCN5 n=1 Tax=Planoprotostelium fungivorum TaxID=1890364 RepID=A0A2P6MV79_9EUKA|nr:N-acetyltransferase GCN5 [Planoprotostelium fungivorum]
MIGCIGLSEEASSPSKKRVYAIGYFLDSAHHGKGITTAALRLLIREVWRPIFADRAGDVIIYGSTFGSNISSQRVLEKAGIRHVGTLHKAHTCSLLKGGDTVDIWVGILDPERDRCTDVKT